MVFVVREERYRRQAAAPEIAWHGQERTAAATKAALYALKEGLASLDDAPDDMG